MKSRTLKALPLVTALALASGWAGAQSSGATGGGTTGTGSSMTGGRAAPAAQAGTGTRNAETNKDDNLSRGDRKFIQDVAGSGMFEVQAAQLASAKATNPEVKSFASKLVDDHQQANNELVQIANAKKVELPAAPPKGKRHEVEKLGKASGANFDKQFMQQVGIKDHQADIKKFEKASKDVKDPQLKAWVEKTLPHLREHLAMAQKIQGGGGAAAMGHTDAKAQKSANAQNNAQGTTQNSSAPKPDVTTATPKGGATGTNTGGKTGS
jgi:putative membrane protein